jgi:SAM-dependent methyltransferase
MKLNLGCSDSLVAGFTNVDVAPPYDQCADLRQPWPWRTSSVDNIRAHDIIEHLPDKIHTMNEAHRVLVPGGVLDIVVPTTDGPGAWQDPQHVSYWNRHSFWYFTAGDGNWRRFHEAYGITACFRVLGERQWMEYDEVVKLSIQLQAVKK